MATKNENIVNIVDLRDRRPQMKVGSVNCFTCQVVVPFAEVFDAWEVGVGRDQCPHCAGQLLEPVGAGA